VLHKKWEAPNLKSSILQVIVPQKRIKREEAHADIPSGGHFRVNKTLEKIWKKRFYWATCKRDVKIGVSLAWYMLLRRLLQTRGSSLGRFLMRESLSRDCRWTF